MPPPQLPDLGTDQRLDCLPAKAQPFDEGVARAAEGNALFTAVEHDADAIAFDDERADIANPDFVSGQAATLPRDRIVTGEGEGGVRGDGER